MTITSDPSPFVRPESITAVPITDKLHPKSPPQDYDPNNCGCSDCHDERVEAEVAADRDNAFLIRLRNQRFIVCPLCGNKRCPHATNHGHECRQSNEPGQKGSRWEFA